MASKKVATPSIPSLSPAEALERLSSQLQAGQGLILAGCPEGETGTWRATTDHWVGAAFGENGDKHKTFRAAGLGGHVFAIGMPYDRDAARREEVERKVAVLTPFVEILRTTVTMARRTSSPAIVDTNTGASKQVFVVHGHDEASKASVARLISQLRLIPCILHEQPNGGRTIIEKFERHANEAGFAVVMLTSDDRGGTAQQTLEQQRPRARQNVILELGYFVGKLGRKRVCVLYTEGVEIPSDFAGVAYVLLDKEGAWQLRLAREMRLAGLEVDLNLL